jgi:hypothetical protein
MKSVTPATSLKYLVIIFGDMNNSAFSYVYRNIKFDLNDCFEQARIGFGQTLNSSIIQLELTIFLPVKR